MRQKNGEIKLFGGVDLHGDNFHGYVLNLNGKKVKSGKVESSEEKIKQYFAPFVGYDLTVAVEISTPCFWFCDVLTRMGIKPFVVNTLEYSRISQSKKKNDQRDAKALATDLLKDNLPLPVYIPNPIERNLRKLVNLRHQRIKEKTRIINRVSSFTSGYGIKIKKHSLKDSCKAWEKLFFQLKEQDDFILNELRRYYLEFKHVYHNIKDIENLQYQIIKSNYMEVYNRIRRVPGIGPVTATAIIAYVGQWNRFKSGRRLASYFGLVPSVRESNGKRVGRSDITKQGNSLVRGYIMQCVLSVLRVKTEDYRALQQWYEQKKIKRGWKKAKVALARKLIEIIFAVVRTGIDFNPLLLKKNSKPVDN